MSSVKLMTVLTKVKCDHWVQAHRVVIVTLQVEEEVGKGHLITTTAIPSKNGGHNACFVAHDELSIWVCMHQMCRQARCLQQQARLLAARSPYSVG